MKSVKDYHLVNATGGGKKFSSFDALKSEYYPFFEEHRSVFEKTPFEKSAEEQHTKQIFRKISITAAVLSVLVGIFSIVGWIFNINILKSIIPGAVNISFNAAISYIMLGSSLWLVNIINLKEPSKSYILHYIAMVFAWTTVVVGAIVLYEYISGKNLGIDTLLFNKHFIATDYPYPGRMSASTSVSIIMLGLSIGLILINLKVSDLLNKISRYMAGLACITGILSIIAYLYGYTSFYHVFQPLVAINAAFLMVIIAVGIIACNPGPQFSKIVTTGLPSGIIVRRLIPAAFAIIIISGWIILQITEYFQFDDIRQISVFVLMILLSTIPLIYGIAYSLYKSDVTQSFMEESLHETVKELSDIKKAVDASTIVVITDFDGNITYVNDAFCQISKYKREELIGQNHRIIKSGYHTDEYYKDLWSNIERGHIWKGEVKNKAKDGTYFWLDSTIYPVIGPDQKPQHYIAIRHNITPLKNLEESLEISAYRQKMIAVLGQKALSGIALEQLMKDALNLVTSVLNINYCNIMQLQDDNSILLKSEAGCCNLESDAIEEISKSNKLDNINGYTLLLNQPVSINNIYTEHRFKIPVLFQEHGFISALYVVIYRTKQRPYGILGVHSTMQRKFTSDETDFLQSVANVLGIAIERKEAEEEIKQFSHELEDRVDKRTSELKMLNNRLQTEIEERTHIEQALRESEKRFKAIFNQTFQFIGLLKPDGTLIEVNETSLQFVGAKSYEVLGLPFWETPWWNHSTELKEKLKQAVKKAAHGEFIRMEAQHTGLNKEEIVVDFSLKPIMDESGEVYLLLPEGRDITARKQMEQELKKVNQDKSKVMAFVSHDLKNPLHGILGYSEMLETGMAGELTEKQHKYVSNINMMGQHMLDLVTQILDTSRLESGKLELNIEKFELKPFLSDVESIMNSFALKKNVTLNFNVDYSKLFKIETDPRYFRQILLNLISNAIKYNRDNGSVTVGFFMDQPQNTLICTVEDTGKGIPKDKLAHIFTEYYRVKEEKHHLSSHKEPEGTGLGLAFIKKLVDLHGGAITVASEEGSGSIFTVRLPLRHYSLEDETLKQNEIASNAMQTSDLN